MLLIWHGKLGFWLPPGGHLEADELPHDAAVREVLEETGVTTRVVPPAGPPVTPTTLGVFELPRPWAMLHEDIPASTAEPAHVHLDLCYLLEADDEAALHPDDREVAAVRWWDRTSITAAALTDGPVKSFACTHLT